MNRSPIFGISLSAGIIFVVLCIRLLTLGIPDLTDPSEARFANAALHMIQSGNWLIPSMYESDGAWKPYLAKPPLAIWCMAISMKFFGVSTWAARFPAFCALLITIYSIYVFSKNVLGVRGWKVVNLYLSIPVVLLVTISAITDPILVACVTGAVVASYILIECNKGRKYAYIASLCIGLGMLTKGPIALLLPLLIIVFWLILEGALQKTLKRLPLVQMLLIIFFVSAPWYVAAEVAHPGFLKYFLVTENIQRYFSHSPDINYGSTHRKPFGISLGYLFLVLLPWSLGSFTIASKKFRSAVMNVLKRDKNARFLCVWLLMTPLFFISSKNSLVTYVFPSLAPAALLMAVLLQDRKVETRMLKYSCVLMSISLLVIFIFEAAIGRAQSTRSIASYIQQQQAHMDKCDTISVLFKYPQSLVFHSWNLGLKLRTYETKQALITAHPECVLLSRKDLMRHFTEEERKGLRVIKALQNWNLIDMSSRV